MIQNLQKLSVKQTMKFSIIVQILTGIYGFKGLTIDVPKKHQIVKSILGLEMTVQVIQFCVYLYFYKYFNELLLARNRYYDWILTTPIMLFNISIYFKYKELLEKNQTETLTLSSFYNQYSDVVHGIILGNLMMLIFGYLGETKQMDVTTANILGFFGFGYAFYLIYDNFAKHSEFGKKWFTMLFIVWATYGIAAMQNTQLKNNIYNSLDLIAKNALGVYLSYTIHSLTAN
jgi:hypothetical protein